MTLLLLLGCAGDRRAGDDTAAPLADPEACAWTPAADLDPAAEVVEVALTAAPHPWDPGTGTLLADGLAYGGQVPGPLLEVEVGQTLRVRFTNGLDADTTIHWHGLRVPEAMDGAPRMMEMVPPGGTFTYEFAVQDAGFYWYHPHMATDEDLERGLYGAIVARAPGEPRPACDAPLVLDDILLDADGQIAPPDTEHLRLMGRLGNRLLVNGRTRPALAVTAGETSFLRLVNAANARYWDLTLPGQPMRLVASDGGWLDAPVEVDRLLLGPGERGIVAVDWVGGVGERYTLTNARFPLHDEHADMSEYDPMGEGENPVMDFVVTGEGGVPTALELPDDDLPALVDPGSTAHQWVLDESMEEGVVTVDGHSYPDVPPVTVPGAAPTAFEVRNDSEMHHPFHLHGNRFQVVAVDGAAPPWTGWKDTVDVPPGATVRFVSALDNPGEWMYHCHILEHAELGMAGFLTVE